MAARQTRSTTGQNAARQFAENAREQLNQPILLPTFTNFALGSFQNASHIDDYARELNQTLAQRRADFVNIENQMAQLAREELDDSGASQARAATPPQGGQAPPFNPDAYRLTFLSGPEPDVDNALSQAQEIASSEVPIPQSVRDQMAQRSNIFNPRNATIPPQGGNLHLDDLQRRQQPEPAAPLLPPVGSSSPRDPSETVIQHVAQPGNTELAAIQQRLSQQHPAPQPNQFPPVQPRSYGGLPIPRPQFPGPSQPPNQTQPIPPRPDLHQNPQQHHHSMPIQPIHPSPVQPNPIPHQSPAVPHSPRPQQPQGWLPPIWPAPAPRNVQPNAHHPQPAPVPYQQQPQPLPVQPNPPQQQQPAYGSNLPQPQQQFEQPLPAPNNPSFQQPGPPFVPPQPALVPYGPSQLQQQLVQPPLAPHNPNHSLHLPNQLPVRPNPNLNELFQQPVHPTSPAPNQSAHHAPPQFQQQFQQPTHQAPATYPHSNQTNQAQYSSRQPAVREVPDLYNFFEVDERFRSHIQVNPGARPRDSSNFGGANLQSSINQPEPQPLFANQPQSYQPPYPNPAYRPPYQPVNNQHQFPQPQAIYNQNPNIPLNENYVYPQPQVAPPNANMLMNMNMPDIKLDHFSGLTEEYPDFKALFQTITALYPENVKAHVLKSHLDEDSKRRVAHIFLSDPHALNTMWSVLDKKHQQEYQSPHFHTSKLMGLLASKPCTNLKELQTLHDKVLFHYSRACSAGAEYVGQAEAMKNGIASLLFGTSRKKVNQLLLPRSKHRFNMKRVLDIIEEHIQELEIDQLSESTRKIMHKDPGNYSTSYNPQNSSYNSRFPSRDRQGSYSSHVKTRSPSPAYRGPPTGSNSRSSQSPNRVHYSDSRPSRSPGRPTSSHAYQIEADSSINLNISNTKPQNASMSTNSRAGSGSRPPPRAPTPVRGARMASRSPKPRRRESFKCTLCAKDDHESLSCKRLPAEDAMKLANNQHLCYKCLVPDHLSSNCPYPNFCTSPNCKSIPHNPMFCPCFKK